MHVYAASNPLTTLQMVKQAYELAGNPAVMSVSTRPEQLAEKLIGVLAVERVGALQSESLGQVVDLFA